MLATETKPGGTYEMFCEANMQTHMQKHNTHYTDALILSL